MNTNLEMKNLSDERLKVYSSFFLKISTLLFGLEITYTKALKSHEIINAHTKFSGLTTEFPVPDTSKPPNTQCQAQGFMLSFLVKATCRPLMFNADKFLCSHMSS